MSDLKIYSALQQVYVEPGPYVEYEGSIVVNGINLEGVTHVSVDGVISQDFTLTQPHTITTKGVSTSEVIAYTDAVTLEESTITIGIPDRAKLTSSGRETLKQRVLKALISDDSSDAFSGLGAGMDSLAGSVVGDDAVTRSISMIREVEQSLLENERPDEPLESSLSRINILGARRDTEYNARLFIQIFNRAGESIETEVL